MTASPNGTDIDARKTADAAELNGYALAESKSQTPDPVDVQRLEQKRLERDEQRARLEAQMRALDAEERADEALANGGSSNGEPASAPTSPLGARLTGSTVTPGDRAPGAGAPAPIGQGRENGAKSMPASRRTSGYGGTFGMEKLSLSVLEPGGTKKWTDDEDVGAEGAQKSVSYLAINDDDPFTGLNKDKHLSAASAALDLAPLPQAQSRAFGSRPFDTLKSSDWSHFPNAPSRGGLTSPLGGGPLLSSGDEASRDQLNSRKPSPSLGDSIASLPAMPSKSVPSTPFGLGPATGGIPPKRTGTSPLNEGFTNAQRGFSNPDLARAFTNKVGGGNGGFGGLGDAPRPYGADPLYSSMGLPGGGNGGNGGNGGGFMPQGYDSYGGFDDDNFGSGALYSAGMMGLKNKRAEADREFNRFSGMRLEDLQGEILSLCKDQHGCRYLQKKLEEGDPAHRDMIFRETYGHFPELMIDPFGNYLCQKLLEHATEEQRSAIIDSVSSDLVGISLNMHGTRAVQKMVDFLAQPRQPKQIRTLIYALSVNVVALIKDLNGNHVIQKCLNKLIPEDNQFIYNAIATNLIEVATHRHGCCVLQRSIDHASPAQRLQLVTEIIFNSLYLVQDPFGNYVIQYILDLNDARFSEPLIRTFIGNVCSLSVQKFSSNVVEKCIRVADPEIRKVLVAEVLHRARLEKLLRDSYGNYVIQTILDYCEINQRMVLVECIRPILPSIRNTPYGKRIQSKLQREDASFNYGGGGGGASGGYGGGRGGYGNRSGGGGGYHPRHLGRPQLQHINALTDVYGAAGTPFMGPGAYGRGNGGPHQGGQGGAPFHGREIHNHSGMSYHAPGPDGQPWLHLRGPAGQPAPNWGTPGAHAGMDPLPATAPSDVSDPSMAAAAAAAAVTDRSGAGQPALPIWQDPSAGFMYANGGHGHLPPLM